MTIIGIFSLSSPARRSDSAESIFWLAKAGHAKMPAIKMRNTAEIIIKSFLGIINLTHAFHAANLSQKAFLKTILLPIGR
ncbi:Uncharacterised protein [uncultured archaeon]|nr:Uncharacterised protein [uncultured archaeon]